MKFFQKRGVAVAVLVLAIIASSAWGLHKAPAVTTPSGGEKLDTSLPRRRSSSMCRTTRTCSREGPRRP